MGAGPSVVAGNGGGAPPAVGCRGGEGFELKMGMLKETPLGKVLSEADLAYFSTFFTVELLAPQARVPMGAGELLVVGEGEVQVFVVQQGLDARTGEQSFVLCSKRRGDLIWVPSVNRLAKQKSATGPALEEAAVAVLEAGAGAVEEGEGGVKHKDLYNVVDTTVIISPFGATLLKLDRQRYEQLTSGEGDPMAASLDKTTIRRVIDCNMEDYLRKVSLFRHLPSSKLAVLGEMCNYEFVKAGHRVCSEGEAGSEIYIVLDGKLAVSTTSGNGGDAVRLATLGPGDYFGELAVLIRIKRIATVVAVEPSLLASIKRHDFRSFMTILPGVRAAMDKVVKEHLIYKYASVGHRFFPPPTTSTTTDAPTITSSSTSTSTGAFDAWEVEDVDPERILMYEGDAPGSVYYLSEGQVRLHRAAPSPLLGRTEAHLLGPGTLLGARAAVLGETERYTVVTDKPGPCVVLKLGPAAVQRHLQAHPAARASLEVLFRRRRTPMATLLDCPEGRRAFAAHLQEEFNLEHLTFYDDHLALHAASHDPTAQLERLQQLHATYLAPSAPSPLNIPDTMRRRVLAAYDAREGNGEEKGMAEVLKALGEVQKEVAALLERDNYARFKNTEAFAALLQGLAALLPTEPLLEDEATGSGGIGINSSKAAAPASSTKGGKAAAASAPRAASSASRVGAA